MNAGTIGNLFQDVAMAEVSFHYPPIALLPVARAVDI